MRRFDAMVGDLSRLGVEIIALSKDTVAFAAKHKRRDDLSFTLLADPGLTVIRQYGVEHHKALEFSGVVFKVFGVTVGLIPRKKKMAIPTTLLVDEHGVIRWIDQAEDYRLRSSEGRVMAAVTAAFGGTPGAGEPGADGAG